MKVNLIQKFTLQTALIKPHQPRVRNKRYRIAISDAIKFNGDVSPMAHRKVATQNFALQFHSNFT